MHKLIIASLLLSLMMIFGCTTVHTSRTENSKGMATRYEDPALTGRIGGVGIESQDIVSITDKMMRDIMANPTLAGRAMPPQVVIDARYFRNESSSRVDRNLITDLLRTELTRAANGRMVFLGREYANMTEKERALEQEGFVTGGTQEATQKALGWDYRLGGRIASLDSVDAQTGLTSRYHQITFEMIERGTGVIVWNGTYQFKKTAQDDILYR